MKIGVFFENLNPEVGGGYTFENEILQYLLKCCSETHHFFVLFSPSRVSIPGLSNKNVQFISLSNNLSRHVRYKPFQLMINIFRKLFDIIGLVKINNKLEQIILKNNIDFLWYLTPNYETLEFPYITVVWDLQHRLQPYFPEVSTEGQWNSREHSYDKLLKRASTVITGTEIGKTEIERFYHVPEERIKILPHPTPRFALEASPDDGKYVLTKFNITDNYLFYPAQFWPHKNHISLLHAVKLLRDKYNLIFPVVFVGSDKGNQQYIKEQVHELDLSTQIHFLGFVSQGDLISLYRRAFALTYISFFGPENLPPLEAFALGCPVIASNVSGAKEQLGDAALLVDAKDPNQIALEVKSLYENSELRRTLILRGTKRAHRFTGEDFVKAVFSILNDYEPIRRCWNSKKSYLQKK